MGFYDDTPEMLEIRKKKAETKDRKDKIVNRGLLISFSLIIIFSVLANTFRYNKEFFAYIYIFSVMVCPWPLAISIIKANKIR